MSLAVGSIKLPLVNRVWRKSQTSVRYVRRAAALPHSSNTQVVVTVARRKQQRGKDRQNDGVPLVGFVPKRKKAHRVEKDRFHG